MKQKAEEIYHRFVNYEWNDVGEGLKKSILEAIETALKEGQKLPIHDVIERFSGENLMKLQKHFVSMYGSDEMAKEKANSFAVGFGKACELMIKELNAL